MDWEIGGSLMARLPNFQMNHRDSRILNFTYKLDAINPKGGQKYDQPPPEKGHRPFNTHNTTFVLSLFLKQACFKVSNLKPLSDFALITLSLHKKGLSHILALLKLCGASFAAKASLFLFFSFKSLKLTLNIPLTSLF